MSGRSELSARVKRLRGDLSQSKFATLVELPQARISEYESGEKRPGFLALMSLMTYARKLGRTDEADWFFGLVDKNELKRFMQLNVAAAVETHEALGAKVSFVMPHSAATEGPGGGGHHLLPVPDWMTSGKPGLRYVKSTDDFIFPFKRGDAVLVDCSETDPSKLLESPIVAYRTNHFSQAERAKLENKWAAKHLSPEEASRRRERHHFPFLRTGIFVGRLVINQTVGFLPTIEVRTNSGDTLFEYFHAPKSSGRDVWSDAIGSKFVDLSILGRYVGWLSAPPSGLPELEALDVHARMRRQNIEAQSEQEQKKK
jgi:transcriptional regulator with XRE-family HTH domain